jgi:peptidoglycan/xylan/chitin deacetylase (PgdA/CDA1 family)
MTSFLPILTFHALDARPSVISFPPRVFQHGIARLHENGYKTLSLLEAANFLRQGKSFPNRCFVITFADGYQTVFDEAFPVLRQYEISATVFLTVGQKWIFKPADPLPSIEGRSMLSWGEIQEMQRWGIAFGAHTLTHPDLTRLPYQRVEAEVCNSKAIIEDTLGAPVACFAYPYGRYDNRCHELVQQYFVCACSDKLGLITGSSDLYALERVDAFYLRTERLFDLMLSRFFPWYIRARNIPRRVRRAIQPIS